MKFKKQKKPKSQSSTKIITNANKVAGKITKGFMTFFHAISRFFVRIWQHSFFIQLIWHLTWLITVIYMGLITVAEYEANIYEATAFLTGKNKGYIALHYTNMITYSYNVLAILSAVLIVVCAKCIYKSFRKVHPKKGQN